MLALLEPAVAPAYRRLRRLKNRVLNRIDPPLVVLAYHRVAKLPADPHQIAVTPENFRAQMRYLQDHCQCVRLEDDPLGRRGPTVAVTFDDGYADNLHEALPILAETEIPATFFISTGTLDTGNEFWSDELEILVMGAGDRPAEFTLEDRECSGRWPSAGPVQRQALHDRLHARMLTTGPQRREEWLEQLRRWAGINRTGRDAYRALTREELRVLAASPLVTIGAHGVTHTPLAVLDEAEQRREISDSKAALAELLGLEVTLFAYPFGGRRQYDTTTRRLCREAGFRRAVTTLPGQAHRWTDPLQMPRQLVRNWDGPTFATRLESFRA
jgi:peptidoglycan/xylan/chitin deacetylase (PgdA/CDA1 family)